jgi:hypothetical protein
MRWMGIMIGAFAAIETSWRLAAAMARLAVGVE